MVQGLAIAAFCMPMVGLPDNEPASGTKFSSWKKAGLSDSWATARVLHQTFVAKGKNLLSNGTKVDAISIGTRGHH